MSFLATAQLVQINDYNSDLVYTADAKVQLHELKNYASVLTDSLNNLTLQDIISGKYDNRFKALSAFTQPAQPYITYWQKINIKAEGTISNWWLMFAEDTAFKDFNAQNGYVDIWYADSAGKITDHQRTGVFVPRSEKTIKENPGLCRVLLSVVSGETKSIYVKIYNEYEAAIISSPQLRNPVIGIPESAAKLGMSILSSCVFLFSILSFFFFFFVREKAYLFFAIYTFMLSQHYLLLQSDIPFVDWYIPEHPHLSVAAFYLLAMGSFIFYALFGRYFINLPQLSRRLDIVFRWALSFWIISLLILILALAFTRHMMPVEINFIFIFLFLVFLIRIAFFNTMLTRLYVAGALWLICFTILGLLRGNGIISLPFNPWPIGQIGQILIYALAIAYKVRLNEKARAQAELIRVRNVELAGLYKESEIQKKEIEIQKNNADQALVELKATQKQLIQSEKMASFGELTAGIAHEIQNPLNFVNNFSDLNKDLLSELDQEIEKGNIAEAREIVADIRINEEKILHHGQRADDIVKNMLQHSRTGTGEKELIELNALADECLRIAYHAFLSGRKGFASKNEDFHVVLKTDFDPTIGKMVLIPQDIAKVLLNLYNNSLYALAKRQLENTDKAWLPHLLITTIKILSTVEIRVRDNGGGIPENIQDKIFQPFFTTKPTGQGTGLGLSLSYDIVIAQGGKISIVNNPGACVEFIVTLPYNS